MGYQFTMTCIFIKCHYLDYVVLIATWNTKEQYNILGHIGKMKFKVYLCQVDVFWCVHFPEHYWKNWAHAEYQPMLPSLVFQLFQQLSVLVFKCLRAQFAKRCFHVSAPFLSFFFLFYFYNIVTIGEYHRLYTFLKNWCNPGFSLVVVLAFCV